MDLIFTEAFNCGRIADKSLESFLKYHDRPVCVYGMRADLEEIRIPGIFKMPTDHLGHNFKNGHFGTAYLFATIITGTKKILHFDSDVIFRKECLSEIDELFKEYDIIGTRRCYKNNPGKAKGFEDLPDSISTYFFGINTKVIPQYTHEYYTKMWQGVVNPLGYKTLDFGDPVIHACMKNGARVKFLDQDKYGSQDESGSKVSKYMSNMHMDFGECLVHYGGVGTGYAYSKNKQHPHQGYAEWALGRYSLYAKKYFNEDIDHTKKTEYADERWVNGCYDEYILDQLNKDLWC